MSLEADDEQHHLELGGHGVRLLGRGQTGSTTNGAAAKVMNFDRLGTKVRPDTFLGKTRRLTEVPKKSLCQKTGNSQ